MGIDISYTCNGVSLHHRFTGPEADVIEVLGNHLPADVAICFETPTFGEPVELPASSLAEAAVRLRTFLEAHPELLPASYQWKEEKSLFGDHVKPSFTTGGISGIRLPGDSKNFYGIDARMNRLVLTKYIVAPDGKSYAGTEVTDIRHLKELATETLGVVRFRHRVNKTALRKLLASIESFATNHPPGQVTKIMG